MQEKFQLQISEYGESVRTYSDNDKTKFLDQSLEIIKDHLRNRSNQTYQEIKNISINIYTFK